MTLNICQIALSIRSGQSASRFYEEVFGWRDVFGTRAYRGAGAERVQGLKGSASHVRWLIDERPFFQLELFEFEAPVPSPPVQDLGWRHIGYNRLFVDAPSLSVVQKQTEPLEISSNSHGGVLSFRDLDGIPIDVRSCPELTEQDGPRLSGLGLSVTDLERAAASLCSVFGFERYDLHRSELEAGMAAGCTLRLGDMFLALRQPEAPILRPADHKLNDIGILNFAVGFTDARSFMSCFADAEAAGFTPNCEPVGKDGAALCAYVCDLQGNSIELLYVSPDMYGLYGFAPTGDADRALNARMEAKAFANAERGQN